MKSEATERTLSRWIAKLAVRNDRKAARAVQEMVGLGTRGLDLLLVLSHTCDRPVVLRWVMDGLGHFSSPAAAAAIRRGLRSPHMTVRLHALGAADRLGTPVLIRAVRPLMRDVSGGIRINALALLTRRRVRGLGAILAKARRDPKAYVRAMADKALR
ncbi:MAG: HEAT repeat domain-containing protein [Planctomycetota bacterium]